MYTKINNKLLKVAKKNLKYNKTHHKIFTSENC